MAICDEPDFKRGIFDTSYLDNHEGLFDTVEKLEKVNIRNQPSAGKDDVKAIITKTDMDLPTWPQSGNR
jgi:hypothetical protein